MTNLSYHISDHQSAIIKDSVQGIVKPQQSAVSEDFKIINLFCVIKLNVWFVSQISQYFHFVSDVSALLFFYPDVHVN